MMHLLTFYLLLSSLIGITFSQGCPASLGWVGNSDSCYLFVIDQPSLTYLNAVKYCQQYSATLVSVNSVAEHNFIKNWLQTNDAGRRQWWTSGRLNSGILFWEGDGTPGVYVNGWLDGVNRNVKGMVNIIYKYDSSIGTFGWTLEPSFSSMSLICEISLQEVYRIVQENRGFDYGLAITNPSEAPRGPKFLAEPESVTILKSDSPLVYFDCVADGNPGVTYQWLRRDMTGNMIPLQLNARYTTVTGRLNILNPQSQSQDEGVFQCKVTNKYGSILSNPVELMFGTISEFSPVASGQVDATEQTGAQMECPVITGTPGLVYRWYKDSPNTFVRPEMQVHTFVSMSGKLLFSEVAASDQGTYYCSASLTAYGRDKNYVGSSQAVSKLSRGFDLVVRKSGGNTYNVDIQRDFIYVYPKSPTLGSTVRLECFAYGSLPLVYTWGRQNRPFPEGRYRFTVTNRVLTLYNVDLSDEGVYFCNVSSSKTNSKDSTSLDLEIQAKPYFIYPLTHQHVDIGTRLSWHCEALGKPFPTYTWYKNGKEITNSDGITVRGNTLTITSLSVNHNGMYQCGAKNTLGETFSTAQLRVLEIAPSFEKSPMVKLIAGAEGGNVTIHCNPIGAPRPTYTWYHDNSPIQSGGRYEILLSGDLHIQGLSAADVGRYRCVVENGQGNAEDYADLSVSEPAQFTERPRDDQVEVNLTVSLLCQASHAKNLDMVYIWSFNDHIIDFENEPEYTLGSGRDEGYLYIRSTQFRNQGWYTCAIITASNREEARAYLTVLGPPGEPAGIKVHELSLNGLDTSDIDLQTTRWLTWSDGAKHDTSITHYTVEFKTEFDETWRRHPDGIDIHVSLTEIENKPDLRMARLTNLKAGASINFRVLSRNSYGYGTPSVESASTKIQGAPPIKTVSNIRGGGGSLGELTIWWDPLPREDHNGADLEYYIQWRLYEPDGKGDKYQEVTKKHSEICLQHTNIEMGNIYICEHSDLVGSDNFYKLYEVRIQAKNTAGDGPFSDPTTIWSAEALPQGSPSSVYGQEYNATAMVVHWKPVPNTREMAGGRLKGYKINYWRKGIDEETMALQNIVDLEERENLNQGMIIGLVPSTFYKFNVQAYNDAGNGLKSSDNEQETLNNVPEDFPTEVYVYSIEGKGVRVRFRGVSTQAGEEPLQGYKVQLWSSREDIRSAREYDLGKSNDGVIDNLNSSTVYQLRVFAYSRAGQGLRSSPTVFFVVGDGQITSNPETTEIMSGASILQPVLCVTLLVSCLMTLWSRWT